MCDSGVVVRHVVLSVRQSMMHWGQWCMLLLCGPLLTDNRADEKAASEKQLFLCDRTQKDCISDSCQGCPFKSVKRCKVSQWFPLCFAGCRWIFLSRCLQETPGE